MGLSPGTSASIEKVEWDCDEALFEKGADALVITAAQNERPLCGLASRVDWRLRGAVSQAVRCGALTGTRGEFTYLPVAFRSRRLHFFFIGMGASTRPGQRSAPEPQLWSKLEHACRGLKVEKLVLSQSDLGDCLMEDVRKNLKRVDTWVIT